MDLLPNDIILNISTFVEPIEYFLVLSRVCTKFRDPSMVKYHLNVINQRLFSIDPCMKEYWKLLKHKNTIIAGSALVHALWGETTWQPGDIDIYMVNASKILDKHGIKPVDNSSIIGDYSMDISPVRISDKININAFWYFESVTYHMNPDQVVSQFDFDFLHCWYNGKELRILKPDALLHKHAPVCHMCSDDLNPARLRNGEWMRPQITIDSFEDRAKKYEARGYKINKEVICSCDIVLPVRRKNDPKRVFIQGYPITWDEIRSLAEEDRREYFFDEYDNDNDNDLEIYTLSLY